MPDSRTSLPERRDIIHRCYMTGQRCVYVRDLLSRPAHGGFSLSEFSGDFNHIWEFKLKSWQNGTLRRADLVAKTGYVMCSRICYPIQESEIIVADVTTANLNVFYELGLACALGKRVLILRHEKMTSPAVVKFLEQSALASRTHSYTSDQDDFNEDALLSKCLPVKHYRSRGNGTTKVFIFSNEYQDYLWPSGHLGSVQSRSVKITDFVQRALKNLDASAIVERCRLMMAERGDPRRSVEKADVKSYIHLLLGGISTSKTSISETIASSDVILIDTSLDDFETYFWLGLCHGLQKEVVPLSISDVHVAKPALPFDIRTLWHVGGTFEHKDSILSQLAQILTEITAKALSARATVERDRFWRPLFEAPKLAFFLGTERSGLLESKQVVGEWDLRTIQEINSFVLRAQSNIDVVIERPMFRKKEYTRTEKGLFEQFVHNRMNDANCIIIGTPDVNPAAELVLSALKGVEPFCVWARDESGKLARELPSTAAGRDCVREGYVAFKNYLPKRYNPGPSSFFLQFKTDDPKRGFIFFGPNGRDGGRYSQDYVPRDKFPHKYRTEKSLTWDLIGHVIIAPNPFAAGYPNTRLRVILIMGVGGPATLGIAHFLTGRPPENVNLDWTPRQVEAFFTHGNSFLSSLNDLVESEGAAEGIVQVNIAKNVSHNDEYEDSRNIAAVTVANSLEGVRNPKRFEHIGAHSPFAIAPATLARLVRTPPPGTRNPSPAPNGRLRRG
jgi:hypothetical protein